MSTPDPYLRLAEPPTLRVSHPTCSACDVKLNLVVGWQCPSCGTTWPADADNGDVGALNDTLTGPTIPNYAAWKVSTLPPDERDAAVREFLARRRARSTPAPLWMCAAYHVVGADGIAHLARPSARLGEVLCGEHERHPGGRIADIIEPRRASALDLPVCEACAEKAEKP